MCLCLLGFGDWLFHALERGVFLLFFSYDFLFSFSDGEGGERSRARARFLPFYVMWRGLNGCFFCLLFCILYELRGGRGGEGRAGWARFDSHKC